MVFSPSGPLGYEHYPVRLQDRVFFTSTERRPPQVYSRSSEPSPETSSGIGNTGPVSERSYLHSSPESVQTPIPVLVLSNTQEGKSMASNSQSEATKQTLYQTETLQDGNLSHYYSASVSGPLGNLNRSQGRILARPGSSPLPSLPSLQVQGNGLLFQSNALRPVYSSKGFHKDHKSYPRLPKVKGKDNLCLSRRLAPPGQFQRGVHSIHVGSSVSPIELGLGYQPPKVGSHPGSKSHVSRSGSRPGKRICLSVRNQDRLYRELSFPNLSSASSESSHLAVFLRPSGQLSGGSSLMSAENEAPPVACSAPLQTVSGSVIQEDPSQPETFQRSSMVVGPLQPQIRQVLPGDQAPLLDVHRCLPVGLGSSIRSSCTRRTMERTRKESPYQRPRAESGGQRGLSLEISPSRPPPNSVYRQFYYDGLHQSSGGNQVPSTLSGDPNSVFYLPVHQFGSEGIPSCRNNKHDGRCSFKGNSRSQRVGAFPSMGRSHFQPVWSTVHRPVCYGGEPQNSSFLHPLLPPRSLEDGCDVPQLEQSSSVRLSTMVHAPTSSPEATELLRNSPSSSASLAQTRLVSTAVGPSDRPSVQIPTTVQTSVSTERANSASRDQGGSSLCLASFRKRLREAGISGQALEIATNSRRTSTIRTYDSRLEKFFSWANDHNVNPMEASLTQISNFLVSLFQEGRQVSTIRNYRSALASVHKGFSDGSTISDNPAIGHLLRGMFVQRPPLRRLAPSWSINDVLSSLTVPPYEPIQDAPLEALVHKTLFLVAAASARRRSELHALSVKKGFIRFSPGGVSLLPDPHFLAKNQTESFSPTPVFLPKIESISSVPEDRLVCPVRALKWLLHKSKNLRSSDALFILPRSPYTAASKDTISKWLIRLIQPHASPSETVRAHDIRAQAASTAWFRGIPLPDIMSAASWKTPSTFVACYLKDVVSQEGNFGRSVLLGSRHQTSDRPSTSSRC